MNMLQKLRSRTAIFLHDLVMIPIAWMSAYWLRFNLGEIPPEYLAAALKYLPMVVLVQAVVFRFFGLYRGVWRFASLPDLFRISKAILTGTLIIALVLVLFDRLSGVPRSVIPLYCVVLLLLLCTPRFLYRAWKDRYRIGNDGARALVVGAGRAGEMLVRDLLREPGSAFCPVAFVDDDKKKRKREIHGIRVEGSCEKIPRLIDRLNIETILIAVPSADDRQMRRIVEICESTDVPFLTLPSVKEILSGRIDQQSLRDVSIEDLLGRAPVQLEWDNIAASLEHKKILVTGGGGSIGAELCMQIARIDVTQLIIFDKSEFNLYLIEAKLAKSYPDLTVAPILGSVTDKAAVEHALHRYRPDIIFHAAAYKHVPLLQTQIREAAYNNVVGTRNVAEAAIANRVSEFVLISTDKAVNPTNIMGACKRTAEVCCQSLNQTAETRLITVRFGNVLDSAGSVVPLFREQIQSGGPVTVTHPEISRFFMTIPEACQLIMQAAAIGRGGEVFVLDMGEPIKIGYLAEQMIKLSGKRPGTDIKIRFIGLRPGEKMHEELFHEQEQMTTTGHSKLLLAQSRKNDRTRIFEQLTALEKACREFDEKRIMACLQALVPEFDTEAAEADA